MTDEHLGGSDVQPDRDDGDAGVPGDNSVVVQEDSVDHAGDPGQTEGPPTAEPAPVPAGADSPAVPAESVVLPDVLREEVLCESFTPGTLLAMGGKFLSGKESLIHVTMRTESKEITSSYKVLFEAPVNEKGVNLTCYAMVRIDLFDE
ncbi:Hypothetical protein GLP15_3533 [Giardia lamblia P15]|uniref:Uncharacterized protein n=1 Tax=Giardia intestinalis (strain P15) TaxID=658858 RepID=E1F7D8_GIAIA|nr:Hypothetical protein GLP15_3533 [Giardia lamblia P15]